MPLELQNPQVDNPDLPLDAPIIWTQTKLADLNDKRSGTRSGLDIKSFEYDEFFYGKRTYGPWKKCNIVN